MFTAAIMSLILSVAAGTYQTINNYQNAKIQQKEAEVNAQQAEYEAQMERNAEAMNAERTRRDARTKIAAARAKYAAYGNVGESADATIDDAYVNLASDLSALHFNSENKAIQAENEALMYKFNAKVAKRNKTSAIRGEAAKNIRDILMSIDIAMIIAPSTRKGALMTSRMSIATAN